MVTRKTELYGLVTDKTRLLLAVNGWRFDGLVYIDPVSRKLFSEPEATAIMLKRLERFTRPQKGIW